MEMKRKLGFGLMRLPLTDPDKQSSIDLEESKRMVDHFIAEGYTYFDTAWMYCGFKSEKAVKEILTKRYPREAYTLTTKLHYMFIKEKEDRDRIFNQQLENTGVEYFDYYLLHDIGFDSYKAYNKFDCFEWIAEKKRKGLVKHIGFSFHDNAEMLDKVLTEHPEFEFVQLQINYLDWESKGIESRKCYETATRHGKPVFVMEPVKGGTLANLPEKAENILKSHNPEASTPSWAIRFAASQPNVAIVLSGMSNLAQMQDNCSFMKEFKPLDEKELRAVEAVVDIINRNIPIPCTGCSYCTDGCPQNIAIPKYFSLYNAEKQELKGKFWTPQGEYYDRLTGTFGKASQCIECGQCEGACPQHLPIIKHLKEVAELFEKY